MGFNSVPLLATGDWIDAAWGNTYWRDNFAALYPYTTAGDLAYGVSAGAALARLGIGGAGALLYSGGSAPAWKAAGAAGELLYGTGASAPAWKAAGAVGEFLYGAGAAAPSWLAKPSVNSLLKNTSAGTPSWLAMTAIPGTLHAKGTVSFAPGQTFSSTWADITGATFDLTLGVTCTILVFAVVTGYNASTGRGFYVRGVVNGTADPAATFPFNGGEARNEALPYIYYATGVTAGTRTVKMQCQADTDPNVVERGRLTALAFVE